MVTIIAGTNRLNSRSLHVAKVYHELFSSFGVDVQVFSLTKLSSLVRDDNFKALEAQFLLPAEKFVFVLPEYNGSFPGVMKLLLDNSDISKCWYYKKAMLTGVADGRAGNLRGLEHMTNILHYLRMNVFYNKIPLSRINQEMDAGGAMLLSETLETIRGQVREFLEY